MRGAGWILLFLSFPALARTAGDLHSRDLKDWVEKKNAKVAASREEKLAAEEREGVFKRSFLPTLEVSAAQESFRMGTEARKSQPVYGAELRVNLLNGGRDRLSGLIQDLESAKKKVDEKSVVAEEVAEARRFYWQLRYLEARLEVLDQALELNRRHLASAEKRIRGGVGAESDRFEFEMKDVELRQEKAEAQLEKKNLEQRLRITVGLPDGEVLASSEPLGHVHEEKPLPPHSEEEHEFLYKGLALRAEQEEASALREGRAWWPRVDAYAAYNQYNEREREFLPSRERSESVIGVRLSLHLDEGLGSLREARAKEREARASRSLAERRQREVEWEMEREKQALQLLHDQVHAAEENIERAEKYHRLTQSEYQRGVKNSPDMLGAAEKLFEAREKRLRILRDYQIARGLLLAKTGL